MSSYTLDNNHCYISPFSRRSRIWRLNIGTGIYTNWHMRRYCITWISLNYFQNLQQAHIHYIRFFWYGAVKSVSIRSITWIFLTILRAGVNGFIFSFEQFRKTDEYHVLRHEITFHVLNVLISFLLPTVKDVKVVRGNQFYNQRY